MTDRDLHWNRLSRVIEWLDMTPNQFAWQVGMVRAENLYHIKNGECGISAEFADRVATHFPEINRTWLLTGVGNMLAAEANNGINIPYYNDEIATILPSIGHVEPSGYANLPFRQRCDLIVNTADINHDGKVGKTQLFLRYEDLSQMEVNGEYVLHIYNNVISCKVCSVDDDTLTIYNSNNEKKLIHKANILHVWRVIAKLEIISND